MALNRIDGVTFRYRAEIKIGLGISAVLLLVFTVYMLLGGLTNENLILSGLFLVMLLFMGLAFLRYSSTLTIDGQGVRQTSLFGGENILPWGDINLQRKGMRRGMVLVDSMGGNKVCIDPDLNAFEQAVEMVRERRRDLWRQPGGVYDLRPNWLQLAVPLIFVLFPFIIMVTLFSYSTDFPWIVGLLLVILMVVMGGVLAMLIWRVSLEGDRLTVRRLTGEQHFQVNEISNIRLDVVNAGRSGRIPVVKIATRQGKESTLRGQFLDAPNLYCVLRTWWEDRRTIVE